MATFVANALSPARVSSVTMAPNSEAMAKVLVPDFQLSLAIGKEGQNARLAARLTGCKIDIKADTEELGTPLASSESRPDTHIDGTGSPVDSAE